MDEKAKTELKLPEIPKPGQKQEGWWSIDSDGSVDGLTRKINSLTDVPDFWKATILQEIKSRVVEPFNYASIDAHYFTETNPKAAHFGKAVMHLDITPSTKEL